MNLENVSGAGSSQHMHHNKFQNGNVLGISTQIEHPERGRKMVRILSTEKRPLKGIALNTTSETRRAEMPNPRDSRQSPSHPEVCPSMRIKTLRKIGSETGGPTSGPARDTRERIRAVIRRLRSCTLQRGFLTNRLSECQAFEHSAPAGNLGSNVLQ